MSNTPDVAMTVIEPSGRRWAQLLNTSHPTRDLIPVILERLALPQEPDYELHHLRSGHTLRPAETLQGAGIEPGAELQLKPVRNKFLYDLLNKLYDEATGYAAKEIWGQVESRLETIFRMDPDYPDTQGLRQALLGRGVAIAGGYAAATRPETAQAATSVPPATAATPPPATTPVYKAPPAQPAQAQPKGRSACSVLAMLLAGIFVVGLVLVGAAYVWFTRMSAEESSPGVVLPGDDEPVLGTGDVQMTLRWDTPVDLDLHVVDPSGEEIWYLSPESASGGRLDVDANATCSGDPPVENVYWPAGGAPNGSYGVSVVYYGSCATSGPVHYTVTVRIDGQTVDVRNGTLETVGDSQPVGNYTR